MYKSFVDLMIYRAITECNSLECQCQPPYKIVNGKCMLAGCSKGEKCPSGAECITIAGGVSYCACPKGYTTKVDGSCEGSYINILIHHFTLCSS